MTLEKRSKTLVVLLVVNKIIELPDISIKSIISKTNSDILIGCINELDISSIPADPRIIIKNLSQFANTLNLVLEPKGNYQGWDTSEFFHIIKLKWDLLIYSMELGYDYVIYSDIDVLWLSNVSEVIERVFQVRKNVHMLVQSFTNTPEKPRLCMGFIALRNNSYSKSFIYNAQVRHKNEALKNSSIGDDDIFTLLYVEQNFPNEILELPQFNFPVGEGLGLMRQTSMPGLNSPKPMIFHANYVVGLKNKRLLLRLALDQKQLRELQISYSMYWRVRRFLKYLKYYVSRYKI